MFKTPHPYVLLLQCFRLWGRWVSISYYQPLFTFLWHLLSLNFLSHIYSLLQRTPMNCPLIVLVCHRPGLSHSPLLEMTDRGWHPFGVMCFVAFPGLLPFDFVLALVCGQFIYQCHSFSHHPSWKEWILGFFALGLLVMPGDAGRVARLYLTSFY